MSSRKGSLLGKAKKRKQKCSYDWKKIGLSLGLLIFLGLSLAAVGYVIFFRSVFAQEVSKKLVKHGVFFEEPDPPKTVILPVAELQKSPHPKIAIILDDMGYDLHLGEELLQLPVEITYSFLPFAPHTKDLERKAFIAGKTILLHLPLEPQDRRWDPGPGALFINDPKPVMRDKFVQNILSVPHAVGVNNHMGSLFTENKAAMEVVIQEIAKRSLIFVDSATSSKSFGGQLARQYRVKQACRQIFLDNDLDGKKISDQLAKLVVLAEKNGEAVGIGHPHEATVRALYEFIKVRAQDIKFVPITAIAE